MAADPRKEEEYNKWRIYIYHEKIHYYRFKFNALFG